jgi:hypothetical protein
MHGKGYRRHPKERETKQQAEKEGCDTVPELWNFFVLNFGYPNRVNRIEPFPSVCLAFVRTTFSNKKE